MLRQIMCVVALGGSVSLGQTTMPIKAEPAPSASNDEVRALRQELAEVRAELARLKAQQPAATLTAEPVRAETLPPVTHRAYPAPVPPQPAPSGSTAVVPTQSRNVKVSKVSVSDFRQDGKPGITVAADVTLHNVPNVPYTLQAALVTPDGLIHTDVRGKPYVATREVRTGDDDDTDDYSVWIDLSTLFSSRPPEDLYVQVRILDLMGRPVAVSDLHGFRRPWK